ncbi:hypothetical protein RND71_005534 [Anisodus tanguticus]|uniref:GH18 domain-containing protein n=1 Tax=Anisodus tanguticus TaxID=243964 RepID=A0AAE1VMS3_9SOLA|nr:hypothetical protein RND71_005534 [Anisodus tanguticus]
MPWFKPETTSGEAAVAVEEAAAAEEAVDVAMQREKAVGRKVLLKRLRLKAEAEAAMQRVMWMVILTMLYSNNVFLDCVDDIYADIISSNPIRVVYTCLLVCHFNSIEWFIHVCLYAIIGKPILLLSAGVYYKPKTDGTLNYPSKSLARSLDWINLMAYNFISPNLSRVTRPHAALLDQDSGKNISGSAGIKDWIKSGMPSKKIVLGLPFFGYAWRLLNRENHDLNAPSRDLLVVVAYAKKNGFLGYFAWHVGLDDKWTLSQEASQAWEA